MPRLVSLVAAIAFAVTLVFIVGISWAQEASRQSVWDGVYTAEQAARGERDYGRACERCHNSSLEGNPQDEVPALTSDHFVEQWSERTVKDLFDRIKRSMPLDQPDSLTTRAYVDIVAYILSVNQFPSGGRELDRDPEMLQQIVIEPRK
jgi:hypothetical protein